MVKTIQAFWRKGAAIILNNLALEILYKLKVIYPNNIKARELILDILVTMNSSDRAKKELNDMMKIKGFNKNKILEFKKKYNL